MRSPSTDTVESPLSADFRFRRSGRNPDGISPVGGLRMTQEFRHCPVMVDEIVELFGTVPPGVLVDATVGAGGHARALLIARSDVRVVGLDGDTEALGAAKLALADFGPDRVELRHARFGRLGGIVSDLAGDPVCGVLFDLGVSSPQLDVVERGFSYRGAGPLDMRMDRSQNRTAADVVNGYSASALAELFAVNGEGRYARRIAGAMVAARPIDDTASLAEVIKNAIPAPARRRGGHPAKRVFQAIRVEVNDEVAQLRAGLDAALDALAPGGRCAVLSYHSGEDRLVKHTFARAVTGGCVCPPGLPCTCGAVAKVRWVFRRSRTPTAAERARNPRADSARLRAVERCLPGEEGGR